jgi:glycerol-3-phosphate cytidylyltransferase
MNRGITFGCWDLLHPGHVILLETARSLCNFLTVAVPTDQVILEDKGELPIISLKDRCYMLKSLKCTDEVRTYSKLEFKTTLKHCQPDILFIGEQWGSETRHKEATDWMLKRNKEVMMLPYTEGISTSDIIQKIKDQR